MLRLEQMIHGKHAQRDQQHAAAERYDGCTADVHRIVDDVFLEVRVGSSRDEPENERDDEDQDDSAQTGVGETALET